MKVFWAWQADIDGRIARHLIREALEEAIDRLKHPRDIEEPPEESRRNDLHLDHDTKGLRGSPEIAHEIFKKIDASTVVIADVTPVGNASSKIGKPLMNPNVAIELGYAFGKLGTDCFLPVLNLAYGDDKTLPFDITHRRHPITLNLNESASPAEIAQAKKDLVAQFVVALEPYLAPSAAKIPVPAFPAAPAKIGKAFYFADGEILHRVEHLNANFAMPFRTVFYMRVQPRAPLAGNLDIHMLMQKSGGYALFGLLPGGYGARNKYGVLYGMPAGNTKTFDSVIQYFRTGEIWGINADILRQGEQGTHKYVFTGPLETTLVQGLQRALQFHHDVTGILPPFYVEVGIVGVAGWGLAHTNYVLGRAPVLASDEIIHSAVLNKADDATQQAFLLDFFEKLNLDSGVARPKGLYGR
jgi:hypothetical protein